MATFAQNLASVETKGDRTIAIHVDHNGVNGVAELAADGSYRGTVTINGQSRTFGGTDSLAVLADFQRIIDGSQKTGMPTMPETLVYHGGAVKALGDGKVGGYLVVFGDPDKTDLSGDFFTPETDFDLDVSTKSRVLYHHGFDPKLKSRKLGVGEVRVDDVGAWIEAQLELRDEYEKALYGACKDGKMGWSSGTASHLVRREKQENGSHKITAWPLGLDASITPTPCEPRTAVVSLKSLLATEAKGDVIGDVDEAMTMAALMRLNEMFCWTLCMLVGSDEYTTEELIAKVEAGFTEYRDSALKLIRALLSDEGPGDEDMKSLLSRSADRLHAGLTLNDHSDSVLAAVKGLSDRFDRLVELRASDGRKLSRDRVGAIQSLSSQLVALHDKANGVIKAAPPSHDELLRRQAEMRLFEAAVEGLPV